MSESGIEIVTDAIEVQRIKDSIAEGEGILRTRQFNGKKRSAEYLSMVRRSVNKSRARIGLPETEL